jgi:hypothetical protein
MSIYVYNSKKNKNKITSGWVWGGYQHSHLQSHCDLEIWEKFAPGQSGIFMSKLDGIRIGVSWNVMVICKDVDFNSSVQLFANR